MIICSMEATIKTARGAAPEWQRELRLAANKRYETKRNVVQKVAVAR